MYFLQDMKRRTGLGIQVIKKELTRSNLTIMHDYRDEMIENSYDQWSSDVIKDIEYLESNSDVISITIEHAADTIEGPVSVETLTNIITSSVNGWSNTND